MRMQRRASDSVAFIALLVLMNCGGRTTRSGVDLEVDADSGENGGSENGGSENDETVVSAVSAQAASSTGSGGDGGSSGYGGTDNVGVAGVGAFPGSGGDSSAVVTTGIVIGTGGTTIDWGEVPVPEGCQMTGRHQPYNDECDLETYCDDRLVSAGCFLEGSDYACGCSGSRFRVYGVGAKEACLYALNGCLRSAAFEAGPFYCDITSAEDAPEGCSSRRECSRVASVGDVKLSEFVDTQVACRMGAWGFECACPRRPGFRDGSDDVRCIGRVAFVVQLECRENRTIIRAAGHGSSGSPRVERRVVAAGPQGVVILPRDHRVAA